MQLRKTFGKDARMVPISANKSMLGHLIGAAGAISSTGSCVDDKKRHYITHNQP
jgi:3-oxoacyl-(acyl-carrier-protein) synthase